MILQALYALAQDERLVEDPDYELRPVAWIIRLRPDGTFAGLTGTHVEPPPAQSDKKRARPQAKSFLIPRRLPSRSGSAPPPEFLADNALYVLAENTKDKQTPPEKARARAQAFRDYVARCADATQDAGAVAVVRFLDAHLAGTIEVPLSTETLSNEVFGFALSSDPDGLVSDRPAVRQWWREERLKAESGAAATQCLVSGAMACPADKHPKVKNLPGGNTSGAALISFNGPAFESYGWSVNENAPISRGAADACAAALNRLLHPQPPDPGNPNLTLPRRHLRISANTTVCYWASDPTADSFLAVFDALLNANEEAVGELYRAVWRGAPVPIEDPAVFYALTLSGAEGRAIVRDWLETTISKVARNLSNHFNDLALEPLTPTPKSGPLPPGLPLNLLLSSLCPEGADGPPPLASQLIHSAMTGHSYRFTILQRAVERTRAEITRGTWPDLRRFDARAALIKAFLNRRRRFRSGTSEYKEILPMLDPGNPSPGYLLGQLMAVLERAQQLSMDANATIVDRYFSGASAAPRSVFVRLLKNSQHHLRKADDDPSKAGSSFRLKRLIDQLADNFDSRANGFPARLSIEQQGLFVLGYHQMRRWLWMNGAERTEWEGQFPSAPSAYRWNRQTAA